MSAVTSWKAGEVATTLGAGFRTPRKLRVFLTYVRKLGSATPYATRDPAIP